MHSTFVCNAKILIIWYIAMQSTKTDLLFFYYLLTQLLPFELFSKKFCLNISELGLEIV